MCNSQPELHRAFSHVRQGCTGPCITDHEQRLRLPCSMLKLVCEAGEPSAQLLPVLCLCHRFRRAHRRLQAHSCGSPGTVPAFCAKSLRTYSVQQGSAGVSRLKGEVLTGCRSCTSHLEDLEADIKTDLLDSCQPVSVPAVCGCTQRHRQRSSTCAMARLLAPHLGHACRLINNTSRERDGSRAGLYRLLK